MRKTALIFSFLLATVLVGSGKASAGERMSISVAPKLWASVENFNAFDNAFFTTKGGSTFVQAREQINLPLAGVAIVLTPGGVPLDFLFNFYGGKTDGAFVSNSNSVLSGTGVGNTVLGTYDAKRTDVEMLLRYRPEEKTVNFFTGLRVNSFDDDLTITTPGFFWTATGTKKLEKKTTIVLWEIGAGFSAPITESGMHNFFGNTTFGFGSFRSERTNATAGNENLVTGGAVAWDMNTGYSFSIGNHFSLSARYRAYVKPVGPLKNGYDLTVAHGPDFGANFRF